MRRFDGKAGGALVVNLFGGPGCGKSTVAAKIFAELKTRGVEAACPEEHAKMAIWSGRPWLLDEQLILAGKTWETLVNLRHRVDIIVADSPILLCSAYAGQREPEPFHALMRDLHSRVPRVNLLVTRNLDEEYDTSNRREDRDAAIAVDEKVRLMLADMGEVPDSISREDNMKLITSRIIELAQKT